MPASLEESLNSSEELLVITGHWDAVWFFTVLMLHQEPEATLKLAASREPRAPSPPPNRHSRARSLGKRQSHADLRVEAHEQERKYGALTVGPSSLSDGCGSLLLSRGTDAVARDSRRGRASWRDSSESISGCFFCFFLSFVSFSLLFSNIFK